MGLVWDCEITRYNWKYLVLNHKKSVICLTQKRFFGTIRSTGARARAS